MPGPARSAFLSNMSFTSGYTIYEPPGGGGLLAWGRFQPAQPAECPSALHPQRPQNAPAQSRRVEPRFPVNLVRLARAREAVHAEHAILIFAGQQEWIQEAAPSVVKR